MPNPANFVPVNAQQEDNLVLAGELWGEPLDVDQLVSENADRVVGSMFRDYEPPARRAKDNPEKELCGHEGCRAFPSKKHHPWCAGHARSRGLIK